MRSTNRYFLSCCLLIALFLPAIATAQESQQPQKYTYLSRGLSLEQAIRRLVEKTNIDLIYDPQLINEHTVYVAGDFTSSEEILRLILKDSGLDFIQLSSGTYVLVKDSRQETTYGMLAGKVVDEVTGQPLAGANIMLADASTGTSTNSSGHFNIAKLKPGQHEVTVTYVGYQAVRDTVWVPEAEPIQHTFSLHTKPVWVKPIVVSDTRKRLPSTQYLTNSSEQPTHQLLGTVDAVRSLNSVMGINFNLGMADYNIQGGHMGGSQLRLDGAPIYDPVSMGRLIGAFNPYALGKIEVYKAGYASPVGSQLSGVVNLNHDLATSENKSLLLQVDQLNLNARFDHQFHIQGGPQINVMLAGRTNIWHWYKKRSLKQTFREWDQIDPLLTNQLLNISDTDMNYYQKEHKSDIHYSDLHLAAEINHSDFQKTRITAYRGKNYLETDLFSQNVIAISEAPSYMSTLDRYDWTNMMGKIQHDLLLSPRLDFSISGYITKHTLNHHYAIGNESNTAINYSGGRSISDQLRHGAIQNMDTGDKNGITESAIQTNFDYSITKNYQLKTGIKAKRLNYRFQLSEFYLNSATSKSTSFLLSGYLQNKVQLSHKTAISAGSRLTFIPSRDLIFIEPRIAFQHDEPNTSVGYLSFRLSGGIYRQFINQFDISNIGPSALVPSIRFWVPIDYSTEVPKSYHLSTNLIWQPGENWDIRSETYYKWVPQTLSLTYNKLQSSINGISKNYSLQGQYTSTSQRYSFGTGVVIEKVLPSLPLHIKGKYQFSLAKQKIPGRFNSKYVSTPSNKPHQTAIAAEWQATSKLMLILQLQNIWGRSWGFTKAYYDYLASTSSQYVQEYSFDTPSNDKLSPLHQLNIGATYKIALNNADLKMSLHLFNLLDSKNVINWWLAPTQGENKTGYYKLKKRTLPGFRPSANIIFSF
ncbi:carboxypeptidase-like regulatory domain-containing protein [Fodinibius halophilus]|uniref:TonB-dependent receptor n=1 Tax=Fodinibius halophilus TaxID=1736908 RepID=A0A6M1T918_9BACT|nr:carboxypeptidase-like regulatory domain-containing protein [Fodinibius halophilus]NGP86892.1 hypothetical protein [Fodinibius halophilus]